MAKGKKDTIIDRYAQGMYVRQDLYASRVRSLYDDAVEKLLNLAHQIPDLDSGKKFYFADNPRVGEQATQIIRELYSRVYKEVKDGCTAEWEWANMSCDKMIQSAFGWKLKDRNVCARWWDRNQSAVDQFFARKSRNGGMNLSQRVWKYTGDLRTEMENCITVAMGEANTAQEMSRKVRKYLQYPDKLFRRVRDSNGKLHLSKNAKAFHPSRGVYRSSYKNAMRLTRTETNAAYRAADEDRWKRMDFVLGYEVKLSNNHPEPDICNDLAGKYPKEFKFTAWHPHCRCYVVPILATEDEMIAMQKAILDGKNPKSVPVKKPEFDGIEKLNNWVENNADRIREAATKPYFITDNYKYGNIDKGLKFDVNAKSIAELAEERHSGDRTAIANAWHEHKRREIQSKIKDYDIETGVALQGRLDALEASFKTGDSGQIQTAFQNALRGCEIQRKWDAIVWDGFTPDQKKNLRELGNAIGVKKGRRMDHEHANSGHVNPLYKKSRMYSINCQTCAPVYNLRRMGFNVEAKGNPNVTKGVVISKEFKYMTNNFQTFWTKPDGSELQYWELDKAKSVGGMMRWLKKQPDGTYQIGVTWKGGESGHTFNYIKEKGVGHFYDPQTNRLFKDLNDFKYYSDDVSPTYGYEFFRIDDKTVNISRVTALIQEHTNLTREEKILQAAQARHAKRDAAQLQEAWNARRVEQARDQIQSIVEPVKNVKSDALDKRINAVYDAIKTKQNAAEVQTLLSRVQSGVEDIQNVTLRKERRIITKTAQNVLKVAKDIPEIDTAALQTLLSGQNYAAIKNETKTLAHKVSEMKKRESAISDVIPDVRNWHKKFTIDELESVRTGVRNRIARESFATMERERDFYESEIRWIEAHKKYNTWEVARDAYKLKLQAVEERIKVKAIADALDDARSFVATDSTRTTLAKMLKEFDTAVSTGESSAALEKRKKSILDELQKRKATLQKKQQQAQTASQTGDPKTLSELDAAIKEYRKHNRNSSLRPHEEEIVQKMKQLLADNDLGMDIKYDILDSVFDKGFLNTFQTGTSQGYNGSTATIGKIEEGHKRLFMSHRMYLPSTHSQLDLVDTKYMGEQLERYEYEKYGHLLDRNKKDSLLNNKTWYGDVQVRFKRDRVKCTWTFDDSLRTRGKYFQPSLVDDPRIESFDGMADYTTLKSAKWSSLSDWQATNGTRYIELQFHGQVTIDDVASMTFDTRPDKKISKELIKKLNAKGIELWYYDGSDVVQYIP